MSNTYPRHPLWHARNTGRRFFDAEPASDPRLSSGSLESPERASSTRARMLFARTLGIVGILATVALAVFAFRSRAPTVSHGVRGVWDDVRLPWDPVLNAGPPPLSIELNHAFTPLAVRFASSGAQPTTSAPVAAPDPALSDSTPRIDAAPSIPAPRVSAPASVKEQARTKPSEPRLSAEEIQRRKERYDRWIEEQRLQRIQ